MSKLIRHNALINVLPHPPPTGQHRGNSGDLTWANVKFPSQGASQGIKSCVHLYGAPRTHKGFDVKFPTPGGKSCIKSPGKSPVQPSRGRVGQHIDRCIILPAALPLDFILWQKMFKPGWTHYILRGWIKGAAPNTIDCFFELLWWQLYSKAHTEQCCSQYDQLHRPGCSRGQRVAQPVVAVQQSCG
jgi:hypothetical protein